MNTDHATSTPQEHIPFDTLRTTLTRIFERHGTSPAVAAVLADNCASAERDGAHSHGVFRIPGYLSTLASGWVDGHAVPRVRDMAPGFLSVDACNGFAQPAYMMAYDALVAKARGNGIALLAIHNSHHFAALWPDVEPLARDGLVALALVNSMACVVPSGGTTALFGTNPIAFAAPARAMTRWCSTLATSAIAHGDVQIAAREGRPLPEAAGVDCHGQPHHPDPTRRAGRRRAAALWRRAWQLQGLGPVNDGGAAGRRADRWPFLVRIRLERPPWRAKPAHWAS